MDDYEIKDTIRKIWDYSSISYDSNPGHGIVNKKEKNAWMQELYQNLPPGPLQILDVGCGTGAMALLFGEMKHQVVGIDLSREMIVRSHTKAKKNTLSIDLLTGDAEKLPFRDQSFDVIVNCHLLWTLPHPESALKEWHRVLKPGGRLLIIDGIYDDKSLQSWMKIKISSGLTRILEKSNTHRRSYDSNIRKSLPNEGGVPEEITLRYLMDAGFLYICTRDLMYILELHRYELPFYKRFTQGKSYYIITSAKNL